METRASYVVVGAFVLAFVAGIAAAVIWLADVQFDTESARYDILFDGSVTGLRVGNPVRYRGVPVGSVTDMRINEDNVEQVRVTIEVPRTTPIKEDAVASLEFQGLTGVAYVQISGGTHEAPELRPAPGQDRAVIASTPSQLEELFEMAPELLTRFIALVDRANAILDETNRENLAGTLANLNRFTATLAASSDDISRLLRESADAVAQLRATGEEAETLIAAFANRSESLAALLESTLLKADALLEESGNLVGETRPVMRTTGRTMEEIGALAAELRPHVGPTAENAGEAMRELGAAASELRLAARNIAAAAGEAAELIGENKDSVSEFSNTGLFEFTQLLAETRILVQVLTRVGNEIERDPAQFLFGDRAQGFEAR